MGINGFLNNYQILEEIGQGGFGQVFLAQESITLQLRAIRKLKNSVSNQADIIHEIEHVSKLNLKNIVAYFHHFTDNNELHFVMEYCPNGTLGNRIQDGNYTQQLLLDWIKTCALCMQEVHEKGIVHKDIKPWNILFDEKDNIKIGDFGLANKFGGTRSYRSPAALFGHLRDGNDHREDIYSLGVTLLEGLLKENPFWGKNPQEILETHQKLDFHISQFPVWLQSVILKAIHQHPELRFQSMAEFAEALEAKQIPYVFKKEIFDAGIFADKAKKLLNAKKWIQAQNVIEHALGRYPENLNIHEAAGEVFLKRNLIEASKQAFEKAITINSRLNVQRQLGEIQLEQKNFSKAISFLSDHLHRNPNDLEAHNLLIKCFYLTQRYQAGIDLTSELLKKFPKNPCFENNRYICEILQCAEKKLILTDVPRGLDYNPFLQYNFATLIVGYKEGFHGLFDKPHVLTKLLFMESRFEHIDIDNSFLTILDSNLLPCVGRVFRENIISFGRIGYGSNHIQIPDGTVISRRHALIINQKNDTWIYDLGSYTGVKLNGEKIKEKAQIIGVCTIEIGGYWFRVTGDHEKLI